MLNNRYRITLGEESYSPGYQTDPKYAAAWKRALERAYGREHGVCGCPGSGERKLTIKLREGSDGYHLARYPHSGPEHANDCRFYAAAPQRSGLQGYQRARQDSRAGPYDWTMGTSHSAHQRTITARTTRRATWSPSALHCSGTSLVRYRPTSSRSSRCCHDRGPDMRFLLSIVWTAMCLAFFMRLGFALQIMDPVDVFLDKDRCAVVKSYGASSCKVRGRAEGNLDGTWTITLPEPQLTIQMPDGPMAYQQPHWRLQGGNLTGVGLFAGLVISSLAGNYLITRRRPERQVGESPA